MIEPYFDKQKFEDLMLFDALIYNTDRHLGNFGLIFDTQTGEICALRRFLTIVVACFLCCKKMI